MRYRFITVFGIAVMTLSLLAMIGLYAFSFGGTTGDGPVIVIYGTDGAFPYTSLRNSLKAADVDFITVDEQASDELVIPDEAEDREVIIAAIGDYCIPAIEAFSDNSSVTGFILIDPEFSGNSEISNLGENYPTQTTAVFAGRDDADSVSDMSQARILFEKLSGTDTLYGASLGKNRLFSSTCYSDPSQNRYLSLSFFSSSDAQSMFFSPIFQSELVQYMSLTYVDSCTAVSASSVSGWFVAEAAAICVFIAGLAVFLSYLPVVRFGMSQGCRNSCDRAASVILAGITLAVSVIIIVFSFFDGVRGLIGRFLPVVPLVYIIVMLACQIPVILKGKLFVRKKKHYALTKYILTVYICMFFVCCGMNLFGLFSFPVKAFEFAVYAVLFFADFAAVSLLSHSDRISRASGTEGSSYFGNRAMLVYTLLPQTAAFAYGVLFGIEDIVGWGIISFFAGLIPFVFAELVKRHTDSNMCSGAVHASGYILIIVCMLQHI